VEQQHYMLIDGAVCLWPFAFRSHSLLVALPLLQTTDFFTMATHAVKRAAVIGAGQMGLGIA
jgi:hypothetical protein